MVGHEGLRIGYKTQQELQLANKAFEAYVKADTQDGKIGNIFNENLKEGYLKAIADPEARGDFIAKTIVTDIISDNKADGKLNNQELFNKEDAYSASGKSVYDIFNKMLSAFNQDTDNDDSASLPETPLNSSINNNEANKTSFKLNDIQRLNNEIPQPESNSQRENFGLGGLADSISTSINNPQAQNKPKSKDFQLGALADALSSAKRTLMSDNPEKGTLAYYVRAVKANRALSSNNGRYGSGGKNSNFSLNGSSLGNNGSFMSSNNGFGLPTQEEVLALRRNNGQVQNNNSGNNQVNGGKPQGGFMERIYALAAMAMGNPSPIASQVVNNSATIGKNIAQNGQQGWTVGSTGSNNKVYKKHVDILKDGFSENMTAQQKQDLEHFKNIYQKNQDKYEAVAKATGVPAKLVWAIHVRESGCDFGTYLHQGDPLGKPAVHIPNDIPVFNDWTQAAIHAINLKKDIKEEAGVSKDCNDLAAMATYAEYYNGLGYDYKGKNSPYVYSGTSEYDCGKYVADGQYSASTKDTQLGIVQMITSV